MQHLLSLATFSLIFSFIAVTALPLEPRQNGTGTACNVSTNAASDIYFAKAHVVSEVNGIEAMFQFMGYNDGRGTFVMVRGMKGLLANGTGPYLYHVHTNPVGADGNCTSTLGHLDPMGVSESLACGSLFPEYCQEGDLSGKHGKLNGTESGVIDSFGYTDNYLRFWPPEASILGRSVVIHSANKTRLACGNIISTLDGTQSASGNATGKASSYVTTYPITAPSSPAQTSTIFTGDAFPDDATISAMPFPLPNRAFSLAEALTVNITYGNSTKFANNTEVHVVLPLELKIENGTSPFATKAC